MIVIDDDRDARRQTSQVLVPVKLRLVFRQQRVTRTKRYRDMKEDEQEWPIRWIACFHGRSCNLPGHAWATTVLRDKTGRICDAQISTAESVDSDQGCEPRCDESERATR
jgi:hypothetical protein